MLCSICLTNEVVSDNPDVDFCLACHFTGRRFETFLLSEERKNVLGRIRGIEQVTSAAVWHLGRGQFNLGVYLGDGRVVVPGLAVTSQGMVMVQPAVPTVDDEWGITVANSLNENDPVVMLQETFDDDELVDAVQQIASGEKEIPAAVEQEEEDFGEELDRTWVTGTGQIVEAVHDPEVCAGRFCVVHNPSDHPMREWPTQFETAGAMVIPPHTDRVCEHGNPHPDPDDRQFWLERGFDLGRLHDCPCNCCDVLAV